MNEHPLTRIWMASVELWASSWQFTSAAITASSRSKNPAADPSTAVPDAANDSTADDAEIRKISEHLLNGTMLSPPSMTAPDAEPAFDESSTVSESTRH